MNDFTELYLNEKPVKALLMVYHSNDETFCREISNDIDSTYAHTVKIISKLKDLEIIETRDQGRKKMLKLTSKGQRQAKIFDNLLDELNDKQASQKGKLQDRDIFK